MIDRRGFVKLLGALGASSLIPLESLVALPEVEKPVGLDEGVWWIPEGGEPVRLEVTQWSVGAEHETMPDYERIAKSHGIRYIKNSGRSSRFATLDFYGPLLCPDQERGTLQMRLKMLGRGEQVKFSDCWMTEWNAYFEPGQAPKQTATFKTGMVAHSSRLQ